MTVEKLYQMLDGQCLTDEVLLERDHNLYPLDSIQNGSSAWSQLNVVNQHGEMQADCLILGSFE